LLRVGELRTAVAVAQRKFGNPEEEEWPPLEALTRGLLKTQLTEKLTYMMSRIVDGADP
jgi:hypothetical protein